MSNEEAFNAIYTNSTWGHKSGPGSDPANASAWISEANKMTTMIKTYCQSCNKPCGDISVYDAPFTGEPTCWECIFNSCTICNGQGMTGWVSPDGDFDFEYCECNPLCLTLEEIQ